VRARAPSPELRATYFASVRSVYDLDIDLRVQLDRGRDGPAAAAAFEASERARSRVLLEVVSAGGGDPAAVAPVERAALDAAAAEVGRLLAAHAALMSGPASASEVRTSEAAIAAAVTHQREALDALRARSPRAAALIAPAALSLGDAQRLLDDDSVVLEYVVAEPRSYVFAVGRRRFAARALVGRTEIDAAARALRGELTARNVVVPDEPAAVRSARIARADAAVPEAAARLYRLVVAPVAGEIAGKRRVLVAPDGGLAYTPFALLHEPPRPGEPPEALLDDRDIVVLPSVSVLAALRARHPRRPGPVRVAVVADPVYDLDDPRASPRAASAPRAAPRGPAGWSRLRFAADEAAAIAAELPADRVRIATGFAAQRAVLMGDAVRDYDILHIAVHGAINARYPDLSGLVLSMVDEHGAAQDGVVRLHELYQLEIGAELVTLSGCDTALGREIRGEGMIGLARGFLHAGARRVVASLWQVQDRATAELMRRFYDGMLARGLSPVAALNQAQRELRMATRYTAPYFWAAFELHGDDRP
jgi:CHAT domain-containing protein